MVVIEVVVVEVGVEFSSVQFSSVRVSRPTSPNCPITVVPLSCQNGSSLFPLRFPPDIDYPNSTRRHPIIRDKALQNRK